MKNQLQIRFSMNAVIINAAPSNEQLQAADDIPKYENYIKKYILHSESIKNVSAMFAEHQYKH